MPGLGRRASVPSQTTSTPARRPRWTPRVPGGHPNSPRGVPLLDHGFFISCYAPASTLELLAAPQFVLAMSASGLAPGPWAMPHAPTPTSWQPPSILLPSTDKRSASATNTSVPRPRLRPLRLLVPFRPRRDAMALLCAGVNSDRTRLLGRWRSDEMYRYLHVQAFLPTHTCLNISHPRLQLHALSALGHWDTSEGKHTTVRVDGLYGNS